MQHRGLVLGPAHTRFNDYVGTVAADDAEVVKDQPSLYELADVDRDRYTILAVDLSIDGPVTATVYAIDRVKHGITRHRELAELSASAAVRDTSSAVNVMASGRRWPRPIAVSELAHAREPRALQRSEHSAEQQGTEGRHQQCTHQVAVPPRQDPARPR